MQHNAICVGASGAASRSRIGGRLALVTFQNVKTSGARALELESFVRSYVILSSNFLADVQYHKLPPTMVMTTAANSHRIR